MNQIKITVPPLPHLQARKSEKWRAFDPEILPMPFAVMDYELAEPIKQSLINLVENSDTGYLGKIPELPESLRTFALARWEWTIETDAVKISPDVGVGVIEICRLLIQPGEKILINTPVYYNFYNWIKELKCQVVDVPLKEEQLHYALDLLEIEKQYKNGVKVHILCNPHNPVGSIYPKEDLLHLAELAEKYGVWILSDEIHAPLIYEGHNFHPFLSVSETARNVGFSFLSATKAFNIAGLKCAQIVAMSQRTKKIMNSLPVAIHSRASLFGAVASSIAYSQCIPWLDAVIVELDNSRKYLQQLLLKAPISIGYRLPECSYFGWLDLRAHTFSGDISENFISRGKIAIAPGNFYGPTGSGFIRMNFATSREIIADAVDRIIRALT